MSTIVEVRIPSEEFALADVLASMPDYEFQFERIVATNNERVMPFIWVSGDPERFDELDDALANDDSVDEIELLSDLGDERLYRMEWVAEIRFIIQILLEENGTIVKAHGQDDHWYVRILFPTRDSLSRTHDFCEEYGLNVDIRNIYEMNEDRGGRFGLTEKQYQLLVTATEEGYYDIPREVTLEELADRLDISHQALSERFRRAYKTLIEDELVVAGESTFGG